MSAAIVFLAFIGGALADESIISFDSTIRVNQDASVRVTETIRVRAEGKQIRRGIYRDFPTRYPVGMGGIREVGFNLLTVTRNGRPEAFHVENTSGGVRIYMGSGSRQVPPGIHEYEISYLTDHQLGFFGDHDELYWNVNGNDWRFAAGRVSATVELPPGAVVARDGVKAYTGAAGATGNAWTVDINADGLVYFETTRPLPAGHGLTIVVTWQPGLVDRDAHAGLWLKDYRVQLIALAGVLLLLGYYLLVWHRFGRDPESGVVYPRFEPPEGISPAALRYIRRMGFDHKAFAAAVIDMAVKGRLTIDEREKSYVLQRIPGSDDSKLSPGEKLLDRKLFGTGSRLELSKTNHKIISSAVNGLRKLFDREYNGRYFVRNIKYFLFGVLITVVFVIILLLTGTSNVLPAAFLGVWSAVWMIGCITLWMQRNYVVAAIFSVAQLGAFVAIGFMIPVTVLIPLVLLVSINGIFFYLLRAPTRAGQAIVEEAEGFREFLSVAESDRMEVLHPPDHTPELFEKFLPFALALDVEHQWSEKFSSVLAVRPDGGAGYSPSWYQGGDAAGFEPSNFASGLGSSLASSVASSSSAPGSSSGMSGGSSGGGGGGGGGGGW